MGKFNKNDAAMFSILALFCLLFAALIAWSFNWNWAAFGYTLLGGGVLLGLLFFIRLLGPDHVSR